MELLTVADFGYTYASIISDDLILATEWLWNVIYAYSYLFLSAALIWYYKLSQLLNKDLDDTFTADESNRQLMSARGNFREYEEEDKPFIENIEDKDRINSLLFESINHSSREISILLSSPKWLKIPKVKEILSLVNKKADEGSLIRILFHASVLVSDGNLPNSIFTNSNIHLRGFEKKLTTDAMIMLLDSHKAIVLDTKNDPTEDNNKYFATYTNKDEFI